MEISENQALGENCSVTKKTPKKPQKTQHIRFLALVIEKNSRKHFLCPDALLNPWKSLMGILSGSYVFSNMYTMGLTKIALLSTVDMLVSLGIHTYIEGNNNDL